MNLGDIYHAIVTQPLLNVLQLLDYLTHDTGLAIILIAVLINLALWPLYQKNYINAQKLKYLQPELTRIQENFKSKPQEMLLKRSEVMKKHGVSNGGLLVLLLQLPFLISLNIIINQISHGEQLNGIYSFINSNGIANFDHMGLGIFHLADKTSTAGIPGYILVALVSISSLLMGLYMFRLAPKPNIPEPPKAAPLFKSKDKNAPDFGATLQKSIEVQSIYVFPVIYLLTNLNFPSGLVLYFLGSSLSGLVRQYSITQYYTKHAEVLMKSILDSDPSLHKDSVDIKVNPLEISDNPQIVSTTTTSPVVDVISRKKKSAKLKTKKIIKRKK